MERVSAMARPESQFKKGDKVRVKDPTEFLAEKARKISNGRVGEVTGFQNWTNMPIVFFPKSGRRRTEYREVFDDKYLELVEA